jgi:peroxin-6
LTKFYNSIQHLGSSSRDVVAFFQVANLEYDVISNIEGSGHLATASMGELGCWIDTSVTRMMQAGVEHSFVPHMVDYLDLGV